MQTSRLGSLTLVTPPSAIENNNESFCIVNFTKQDQDKFSKFINKYKPHDNINIYVVDYVKDKKLDLQWLTSVIEKSQTVIISSQNKLKILKTTTANNLEDLLHE